MGAGTQRSNERAESLYEHGCELGSPEACTQAGDLLSHPQFSPTDPDGRRAEALYLRGGDQGGAARVAQTRTGYRCEGRLLDNPQACFEALRDYRKVLRIGTPEVEQSDLREYTGWVNDVCARARFEDCGKFPPPPEPEMSCYERTGNGDCPDAPSTKDADAGP
jgi:hypothetical protein